MQKVRIYELAKKLGVKSKVILEELSKLGIEGKTHSSNIELDLARTIEDVILKKGFEPPKEDVHHKEMVLEEKSKALLIPGKERLKVLDRFKKERWKEYLKDDMGEPIRLSIEKMLEKHVRGEPLEGNEFRILSEKEKSEVPLVPEEKQPRADLSGETELKMADLPTEKANTTENKSIITGLIISAIFVITVLFFSLLNYFVFKSPTKETPKIGIQKEGPAKQVQSQAFIPPKEKEAVSQNETADDEKDAEKESLQSQKPSRPIFTVQVGAFSDASRAKFLKARLNKRGYNAYITISKSKKEGRFYKVLVGKFSDREKAEILSSKIKKTEDLQAFVTTFTSSLFI